MNVYICMKKNINNMFREKIAIRIIRLGVKQNDICKKIGLTAANFSSYLQGGRTIPYEKMLAAMECLGLSVGKGDAKTATLPIKDLHMIISGEMQNCGIKAKDLAERSEINSSSLSSYLTGKRGIPCQNLENIMDILNLKILPYESAV